MDAFLSPVAALATPPGRSAVSVVRLSGRSLFPLVAPFLRTMNNAPLPDVQPRLMTRALFIDPGTATTLDHILVVHFPAPHSFTGEDVIELHSHGAPVVIHRILELLAQAGIEPAPPGEFSRRAFLNGKLDLVQAEAIMSLIEANSLRAAQEAERLLSGALSATLHTLRDEIMDCLAHIEAALEFSEEDINPDEAHTLAQRLRAAHAQVVKLTSGLRLGQTLSQGALVVILGQPNVGKSSLFNRIAAKDRAIVSSIPGTTRDYLETHCVLSGLPLRLVDTAGLREAGDPIEQEGVRRALSLAEQADLIVLLVDCHTGLGAEEQALLQRFQHRPLLLVWNKVDLEQPSFHPPNMAHPSYPISSLHGTGMEPLLAAMHEQLTLSDWDGFSPIITSVRQSELVRRLAEALDKASNLTHNDLPLELVALALNDALRSLGEMTGAILYDHLLDRIFASFCIGK